MQFSLGGAAWADDPPPPERAPREIYVPFADLHVLLEQQPQRVLLPREEYDALVKRAKRSPETHAPLPALTAAADYTIATSPQRAEIRGDLSIDVLEDGLHALPLDLSGVGLQSARLDGRAAPIGRADDGRLVVFVEKLGPHRLELEMVAPLVTTAARGVLNFRLPRPPAAKLHLMAPGDVEVKAGAEVISRTVDPSAKLTRFELLPHAGDTSLVMTLNSHLQRQGRAVMARSVLIDEVAEAYERLSATVTFEILHRPVDQFQLVVPEGFEITEVTSPLLARWDARQEGGRKVLDARLREPTTETVMLQIGAIRTPAPLGQWQAPRLVPLDVLGSVAIVGLLVGDRLKAESLAAEGLIPIDVTQVGVKLTGRPAEAAADGSSLRPVAAWYAPQSDYSLAARFVKPPAELAVTTSLLLVASDQGLELMGGLALLPQHERRFSFDVSVPANWQVMGVTDPGGKALPFEQYSAVERGGSLTRQAHGLQPVGFSGTAANRVRITVPGGIAVGAEFKVNFRAVCTPAGWLAEWKSQPVAFPRFAVLGAADGQTAIAVDARDDLSVRPEKVVQLTPLAAAEKPKYGLANVATTLAYRCEGPGYAAALVFERTAPRLTARTFSFFRVDRDALNCHYELNYTVEEARTGRLGFSLPADTPESLSVVALDGVKLKEYTPAVRDGRRHWNVLLADRRRGRIRLAVDFQQPLPAQESKTHALPVIVAEGVAYQSGLVAVEGCAELDVEVKTSARPVDVGELAEAEYQPGRRLLGAYSFVGSPEKGDSPHLPERPGGDFVQMGTVPFFRIVVLRHPGYGLYSAIVQRCELDTNVSPQGWSQTQAVFRLRTKAVFLQVRLPAGAELWSAELDGVPLRPQKEAGSVLIDVPAAKADAVQTLQIVYAAPTDAVRGRGTIRLAAPKLFLRAESSKESGTAALGREQPAHPGAAAPQPQPVEVPLADLVWRLHLPNGYEAVSSGGTVATDQIKPPPPAALQVAGTLYELSGGVSNAPFWLPAVQSRGPARVSAPVLHNYGQASSVELPSDESALGGDGRPAPAAAELEPSPQSVGRITGMADCRWAEPQAAPPSAAVPLGRTYELASGLMEITYQSGAKVVLQGPCAYEVESANGGFLSLGKLTARTEGESAEGGQPPLFVVRTPTAVVTELGAPGEFGVEVDRSGKTDGKTFRGSVEVQGLNGGAGPGRAIVLRAGQSVSVNAGQGGTVSVTHGTLGRSAFVRRLRDESGGIYGGYGGGRGMPRHAGEEKSDDAEPFAAPPELPKEPPIVPSPEPAQDMTARRKEKWGAAELATNGSAKMRLREVLKSPTQLEFKDTPLSDVIDYLKDLHKIEIQIDTKALGEAGISPDAPITKSLKGVSLRSALRLILREHNLTYLIGDGVLLITTPEKADKLLSTKVYPTDDLVLPESNLSGLYSPARRSESLLGVASLKIDVLQSPETARDVITFRSLGVGPRLEVTLVDRSRLAALRWGLALLVGLLGVALTCRPARRKTAYVAAVLIFATLLPLVTDGIEVAQVCNMLFFAASLLVPYYLLVALLRWSCGLCCRAGRPRTAAPPVAAAIVLLAAMLSGTAATAGGPAADNEEPPAADGRAPYVVQIVKPPAPVKVPEDAIILPYDPDSPAGIKGAGKLLVPYDRYVELWNRAHPDKKIGQKAPPAPYAMAGASYKTLLDGDEYLLLTGQVEIDVFSEEFVQVPLGLGGGVLAQAQLDGKPARLSIVAPAEEPLSFSAKPRTKAQRPVSPPMDHSLLVLQISGKGRHRLELAVRLRLSRQGGWRVAEGMLPAAPAAALEILVPKPRTEVRLTHVADRQQWETEKPDETIRTALATPERSGAAGSGTLPFFGSIGIRWRPEVAQGETDRTLSATSAAVLDVQEDGLRLTWRLDLEFRRAEREQFSVDLPAGYLLEKVEGNNVRGWEIRQTPRGQMVSVSLLQAAKDHEQFTLRLWRAGVFGGEPAGKNVTRSVMSTSTFDAPLVTVPEAALHRGELVIRRSPLLEVRTLEHSGVTRIDLPDVDAASCRVNEASAAEWVAGKRQDAASTSPLGVRPLEAYRFAAVPFTLRLEAKPAAARVSATVQTVLRLSEYEREMESRILLDVQGRQVYRVQMYLPERFRLDRVLAPGEFQYAVTQQAGRPLLTIYLAAGQAGDVPVVLSGKLGQPAAEKGDSPLVPKQRGESTPKGTVPFFRPAVSQGQIPLPRLEVLGVDRQQGDVAVEVDPAFDVEANGLMHCEPVLLGELFGWLNPAQRGLARLALHYTGGDYAGVLRLGARTADVSCDAVSNVRVTDRALEETIFLDFTIRQAGIRRLSILLPAEMADARLSVPMLRQKTVEPMGKEPGSPVRMTIELQDEVMGQLRVLLQNDRLLTPGSHEVPIPVVVLDGGEKGDSPLLPDRPGGDFVQKGTVPFFPVPSFRLGRRYVVIENTGRDEVKVEEDKLRGIDVLGRRQEEWETLKRLLGGEITMAYLVSPDARQPRLSFHTEAHAAVATVKAGIGLIETTLVLDAAGAYRAQAVLRVTNATEQFLEVRLPEGAELWAARVADEPVKPTKAPGKADPRAVRIPLVKTAPGDLYYPVVLKYGGKMPALAAMGSVDFPLLRCVNIQPDLSQVKLYVPQEYRWFDFGGTMTRAEEADYQAGDIEFRNKQLSQLALALQQGDQYTKARAEYNYKVQKAEMDQYKAENPSALAEAAGKLQSDLMMNYSIDQQVSRQLEQQQKAAQVEGVDNRGKLNAAYTVQLPSFARNVVTEAAPNFGESGDTEKESAATVAKPQWKAKKQPAAAQVFAPQIVQEEENEQLLQPRPRPRQAMPGEQAQRVVQGEVGQSEQGYIEQPANSLQRYQQRLAQKSAQTGGQQAINAPGYGPNMPPPQQPPYPGAFRGAGQRVQQEPTTLPTDPFAAPPPPAATVPPQGLMPGPAPTVPPALEPPRESNGPVQFNRIAGPGGGPGPGMPAPARPSALDLADVEAGGNGRPAAAPACCEKAPVQPPATGLASLDVEFPIRGTLLRFTTPRGDAAVTARNVSNDLLRRLLDLGIVAAVLVAAWIVVGLLRRVRCEGLARPLESWLLIAVGGLMLVGGVLPVLGLALILAGVGLKLHRWRCAV